MVTAQTETSGKVHNKQLDPCQLCRMQNRPAGSSGNSHTDHSRIQTTLAKAFSMPAADRTAHPHPVAQRQRLQGGVDKRRTQPLLQKHRGSSQACCGAPTTAHSHMHPSCQRTAAALFIGVAHSRCCKRTASPHKHAELLQQQFQHQQGPQAK
jgi:hypothetical protein